ncbi:Flagellar hook-length control protein FliK OS=Afipia felis OX=1035 GN=NCTC12722_01776 PE=4 SV=1 [Afipia felis]
MAISINPVTPVIAADAASPSVTLQPGSVIDAKVLQVLANDFVRIAVASLSIEVASEVPLQVGQALQLAVSQTPDGVRLQIVPQTGGTSSSAQPATLVSPSIASGAAAATTDAQGVSVTRPLTPLEVVAVAKALQSAAGQQGSLSPLFANLTVAATSGQVPEVLQRAAHSLLAGRPALNEKLSGADIATAFRQSGLFYEQSQKLAAATNAAGTPDLKAALIVFRQILGSWLGGAAQPPSDGAASPGQFAQQGQVRAQADIAAPSIVPVLMPEAEEIMLPGAVVSVTGEVEVEDLGDTLFAGRGASLPGQSGTASSADSLQMILRAFPKGVQDAVLAQLAEEGAAVAQSAAGGHAADADGVPPPFRGAATSAQPAVPPAIDHRTPADAVAHRLLNDTDAALARQTLLQIASLPDQAAHAKFDPTARWNFEVPFATAQGTAVAQFEISRDGSGEAGSAEASDRVWRARFSIDLEPAGPVHAQVSLVGERASVRMWADRDATAAQLRAEAPRLSQALREAELTPGDIVIGSGAPPAQSAPRGHFLDRAL